MGNDFGLKVGMTMQQVLNSISGMAVTDKTKQFIIDFCRMILTRLLPTKLNCMY